MRNGFKANIIERTNGPLRRRERETRRYFTDNYESFGLKDY